MDLFRDARPGAWNDPDLLQIGNGGSSLLEYTSEFSLWAEMAAPLIASTNIAALTQPELAIYENPNVIAVDQDPLGRQGVPISNANGLWVMTKQLSGGGRAVLLFNSTNTAATISTTATAAGLPSGHVYQLNNLWTNAVTADRRRDQRVRARARGRDVQSDDRGQARACASCRRTRCCRSTPPRPSSASAPRRSCPSRSRTTGCPMSRSSGCRCRPGPAGWSSRSARRASGCSRRASGSRSPIA